MMLHVQKRKNEVLKSMRNDKITKLFLLVGLMFSITHIVHANPEANFQVQGGEWVRSDNDSLLSGTHIVQYTYGVSIFNREDDSHTVLGNITYTSDADNVVDIGDENYSHRNGSIIHWIYPQDRVIVENDWIYVGSKSGYYYPELIPININRQVNKSIFNSNSFQLATFNVKFENSTYDYVWGGIQAKERTLGNETFTATMLLDTFSTDAPIFLFTKKTEHYIHFSMQKSLIETNRTYNFSVVIKLNSTIDNPPPNLAIEYKPYFAIALETDRYATGGTDFVATTPVDILPDHIHYSSASTNISNTWSYSSIFMRGMELNEVFNVVTMTTQPVLTTITVTNASVPVGNNATLTATTLDQFGAVFPTTVSWTVGNIAVGTIDADTGVFTAISEGTTTIIATNGTVSGTATVTVVPTVTGTKGDVSGDGKVDIVDALFIAQFTVGSRTLTPEEQILGDVNADNKVDVVDALFIAQFTVGSRVL